MAAIEGKATRGRPLPYESLSVIGGTALWKLLVLLCVSLPESPASASIFSLTAWDVRLLFLHCQYTKIMAPANQQAPKYGYVRES